MPTPRRLAVPILVGLVGLVGLIALACASAGSTTESSADQELRIEVDKTGGIAGVSYQLIVENDGTIRGGRCEHLCDWNEGDVLGRIDRDTLEDLVQDFADAGLFQLHGQDFGDRCCDFFFYELRVRAGDRDATIRGAEANLPQDILAVIQEIERLIAG